MILSEIEHCIVNDKPERPKQPLGNNSTRVQRNIKFSLENGTISTLR